MIDGRIVRALTAAAVGLLVVGVAAPAAEAAKPVKPPAPVITSSPPAFTTLTTATISFTDASATATLYCSLDGATAKTCTSPMSYSGLTAKLHTFAVYAFENRQKSATTSVSWTVDLTPPAAPTVSQPASPTNSTSYSITFSSASTDVQSYQCSLDGAAFATCTSPATGSGLAAGAHTFAARAIDKAGNVGSATKVSWTIDTSTPVPVISSGPPSVTNSTSTSFTFSSTEPGVTFTCTVDAKAPVACTSPYATTVTKTTHTFFVTAKDKAGNTANSATYSWKVQTPVVPSLAWTSTPAADTNLTSDSFGFTASGTTTLACVLDGVTQGSCTSPAAVSGLTDGVHTFTLLADSTLSTQTSLTYSWNVDATPPGAPTVIAPTGTVASPDADITVTPASVDDVVTCTSDLVPVDCSAPFTLTGLPDGPHTVQAVATDLAGNTAETDAYWVVDTTAPTATLTAPTTLTDAAVVSFDEDVTGVSADSVTLADELGTPLASTMTCLDYLAAATDCAGTAVAQVRLVPTARLVPGQNYLVVVNPATASTVTDGVGNVTALTSMPFRATTDVSEASAATAWTWRAVKTSKAKGGSYLTEHRKGAQVTWTFKGTNVSWITVVGPTQGKATVLIDGVAKATVNNYAKATKYGVTRTYKGLTKTTHTITVVATGKKGAKAAKGTYVSVDAFKVGRKLTSTPTVTAKWQVAANAGAVGGSYAIADLKGQTVKLTFRGTGISWLTATGPAYGKATVTVDGVATTFDNYSAAATWGVTHDITGLTDTTHTVVIKVLGTKSTASKGTGVVVDGFTIS